MPPGGGKGIFIGGPLAPGLLAGGNGGNGSPRPPGAVGCVSGLEKNGEWGEMESGENGRTYVV